MIRIILILCVFTGCQSTEQKLQLERQNLHKFCGVDKHKGLTVFSQIAGRNEFCERLEINIFNLKKSLVRKGKSVPDCKICGRNETCVLSD